MIPHTEVIERYQNGESSVKISDIAGISVAGIFGILHRNGIASRKKEDYEFLKRKYNYDEIAKDYSDGMFMSQVAEKHGTTAAHVLHIINLYGIARRGREGIRRGAAHPMWTGGKTNDIHGYIVSKEGKEHRLVMEQVIGRPLEYWEHVHHIDGNKQNNNIENLAIIPVKEHARFHTLLRQVGWSICKDNFQKLCRKESEHMWRFSQEDSKAKRAEFGLKPSNNDTKGRAICRVHGCGGVNAGHHFCSKHYQRYIAKKRGYWKSSRGRITKFLGKYTRTKNALRKGRNR